MKSRVNHKHDAWRRLVTEEVARLTGRSFYRFARRPMFSLMNSPEWVRFLIAQYEAGATPKDTAKEFLAKWPMLYPTEDSNYTTRRAR